MKSGCFGKVLTFIFGVIVGFVLFAGTLAGGIYYLVTGVTINDVEKISNTEFAFIDGEAEVRDKSLIDIYKMVVGGDIKNITVAGVKSTFGIDIVKMLESTLEITIDEESKAELNGLKVLEVFKDDNLKIVLNCITLNDVLTKAGIDKTNLDSKPLISEHYGEPVINAMNAILNELDFNTLTIGELEYLVGLNLGSGLLDNFRNNTINELGNAINGVTLEKIIPEFDRDTYIKYGDAVYYFAGYTALDMVMAYEVIPAGAEVAAADRYVYDTATGTVTKDESGTYRLAEMYSDLSFEDFYSYDGTVYSQTRHGAYIPTDGVSFVAVGERYSLNDTLYEQDNGGLYRRSFTNADNGSDAYQHSYVKKFVEVSEGVYELEQRGLVKTADYVNGYYTVETVENAGVYTNNLIEAETYTDGVFALRTGTSARVLQAFADMTLNTIDTEINNLKLGEIITIDETSPKILQTLKDSTLSTLSADIGNVMLSDIIDVVDYNTVEAAAGGEYTVLKNTATNTYVGSYILGKVEGSEEELKLVKYIDGLDAAYFDTAARYNVTAAASSGILIKLGALTVNDMQTNLQSVIDTSELGEVIDIKGDVYYLTAHTSYAAAYAADSDNIGDYYVYVDANEDILRTVEDTDTSAEIYKKIYSGQDNAIVKKMFGIKISEIGSRIDTVVDETKFSEVIEVNETYILEASATGTHIALPGGTYYGTYSLGRVQGDNTDINFVKYIDGMDGAGNAFEGQQRYNILANQSNGALIRLNDKKIGDLTDGSNGMQSVIDNSLLSDVMDISGNVYVKLAAANYADAQTEAGVDVQVYYLDTTNLFLKADATSTATEYYKAFYEGTSNSMLRKLATITVSQLGTDGTIEKAVNDCTLSEVGVSMTTGSLLYQLRDTKIGDMETATKGLINSATMSQLNDWGDLGLTEAQLNKTVGGERIGDMHIAEFLAYAIDALPST